MNAFERLVEDALAQHWRRHPVTASFAGETAFDERLPAPLESADDRRARTALAERLAALTVPDAAAARLDARYIASVASDARVAREARARAYNPAWYTGEAAFGLIALLLRVEQASSQPRRAHDDDAAPALRARLDALPGFFDAGIETLAGHAIPAPWRARARAECGALTRLLREGLGRHPWAASAVERATLAQALAATQRFAAALDAHDDADPACGRDALAAIMRDVHGLDETPESLERRAVLAFGDARERLRTAALRFDPRATWRELVARAAEARPAASATLDELRAWHERALAAADALLTPERAYGLTFAPLPAWAQPVASDLYFLFYRSPAAARPGNGSVYWSAGAPSSAEIKLVHAVHHGSIGHHTQNARARRAGSRFARIAATDGALGLAFLEAGTLAEGWACYAEDLLAEVPGFYTELEHVLLHYYEMRNVACALVDLRLHVGTWSLDEAQRFYGDEVAFAPARIAFETVRNSIFPGSRLMYWVGSQAIAQLRNASPLSARAFHDRLLDYGSAPVAWLAAEMAA